jgi:hypothetical protein
MQGACYLLTTNNFSDDFEIIGAAFSGEFHLQGSPESFTAWLPPGVSPAGWVWVGISHAGLPSWGFLGYRDYLLEVHRNHRFRLGS